MQRSIIRNLALTLSALCVAGCRNPDMRFPNFAHPGTAAQQRAVAEQFDPYPDPDAGPPVVGGRPIGYTRPLTETEWGRRYAMPPGGFQASPMPVLPTTPVFTNPFTQTAPPAYAPTYSPAAYTPTYPPALPPPTTPTQIQPRNPY